MPICNKILAMAGAAALFAAPALADGVPGQTVNRGPSALQTRTVQAPSPAPDCVRINETTWSCPGQKTQSTHQRHTHAPTRSHSATHTVRSHAPATTHHRAAPTQTVTTHRQAAPTRTVQTQVKRSAPVQRSVVSHRAATTKSNQIKLDLGSFQGGVGGGVDGLFYGGGGGIILGNDKRFSGVLSSAASRFTFQNRRKPKAPPKHPHCGC